MDSDLALGLSSVPDVPATSLEVRGRIPDYVNGALYRNGPGVFDSAHADGVPYSAKHWFEGLGVLHAFRIAGGAVVYESRFMCPGVLRAVGSVGKKAYVHGVSFAERDPCLSILGKFMALWKPMTKDPQTGKDPTPNVNVTLQRVPGKGDLVARTDYNMNCVVKEASLEPEHFFTFGDINPALSGQGSPAHGQTDPDTGDFFSFVFDMGMGATTNYSVFRVKPDGDTEIVASFKEAPRYVHSFSITPNYVIMCMWPCHLSTMRLLWHRSMLEGLTFDPQDDTTFIVISRAEKKVVARYSSDAFFCFHTVNAFERDNAIHIDLSHYEDAEIMQQFRLDYMRKATAPSFSRATLARYTLDSLDDAIVAGADASPRRIKRRSISDVSFELPIIAPQARCRPYRYAYGVSVVPSAGESMFNAVVKVDTETEGGAPLFWSLPRAVAGEPIFVPDPNGKNEDDGVLLVVVLDPAAKNSFLLMLCAKTMTEVARATAPQVVPLGFHGSFIGND